MSSMANEYGSEVFDDLYLGVRAGGALRKRRRGESLTPDEEEALGRWQRLSAWRKGIAIGGFAYALIRFAEAYGLWHAKVWAEWFALISGCLYLPLEIFELLKHANLFKWSVLAINLIVVIYIALIRMESHRARVRAERIQLSDPG